MSPDDDPPKGSGSSTQDDAWVDDDAGRLVRPYSLTRGRTRSSRRELDLFILLTVVPDSPPLNLREPEYAQILGMCQLPISVAEISSRTRLPTAVVKVLVGDLLDSGHLERGSQAPERDPQLLQAVLEGLRRL